MLNALALLSSVYMVLELQLPFFYVLSHCRYPKDIVHLQMTKPYFSRAKKNG